MATKKGQYNRKSKKIYNEAKVHKEALEKQLKELEESKRLLAEAEKEEKELLDKTYQEIQELCDERGMRCGIALSSENINAIVNALIQSNGKPIFLKYVVEYYDEDDITNS